MTRRDFIKITALGLGGSGLVSWDLFKKKSELEDLYAYLESHLLYPRGGKVPFKLYPFQKQILKQIHENDKVVIVKARRIGMTTLLAGYMKWKSGLYQYDSCNFQMNRHFNQTLSEFRENNKRVDQKFHMIYDEYNHKNIPLPYIRIRNIEKLIIVGTPDVKGNLKYIIDNKDKIGIKVFTYSAYNCYPMWDRKMISGNRNMSGYYCSEETFLREVEAKV